MGADLQNSCNLVYGDGRDSLCIAQAMSACEVVGGEGFADGSGNNDRVEEVVPNPNPSPAPVMAPNPTPEESDPFIPIPEGFSKVADGVCRTNSGDACTFDVVSA